MLIHIDSGPIDQPGDIFHSSKVFMYDFERGKSIKGVVLNKQFNNINVGGPVGLTEYVETSEKVILHNIPNNKNSKRSALLICLAGAR